MDAHIRHTRNFNKAVPRLQSLYVNQLAVDDDLIDMLHDPSADVGALEAFVSIITGKMQSHLELLC